MSRWTAIIACAGLLVGCDGGSGAASSAYELDLPAHFPEPPVPEDNPMTTEKVELGRYLFFDARLSDDQTASCASCHVPALAFSGESLAIGHDGQGPARNVPSLANAAYMSTLTWARPDLEALEQLAVSAEAFERVRSDPVYAALQQPRDATFALASFIRTMVSGGSDYDVFTYQRDLDALSESAARGFDLFYDSRTNCFVCHDGFNLTRATNYAGLQFVEPSFHNTGLYDLDGAGAYPAADPGLVLATGLAEDTGKFRTPSLRNIALTGPYYHDGSESDLGAVLDNYAAGGRVIDSGPDAGDGRANPHKSDLIVGFEMSASERADLIAFLESLTDTAFVSDERFADPWTP